MAEALTERGIIPEATGDERYELCAQVMEEILEPPPVDLCEMADEEYREIMRAQEIMEGLGG
jgi:hypothetical protein